ncbi:cartilage intermediate layer protein 1 [Austrofundulus limnaeus]|uniref:Cartilage intermediate layer protein 1 n=1 Tax=Austrofundulus limnaeus TaxID=52670 RepID=A0A2I4AIC3_AUSLI|nr:PREDICTED: cartilage intermediate layer protein 1-like [Austrofundulus limnaeus]
MIKQLSFTIATVLLLGYIEPSHQDPVTQTAANATAQRLCWTNWYNEDHPRFTGDAETLEKLREEFPGEICSKPQEIQAVRADNDFPAEKTGQKFYAYNTEIGFICRNKDQHFRHICFDYKVRFKCPCSSDK